jgi:hypothetical protein
VRCIERDGRRVLAALALALLASCASESRHEAPVISTPPTVLQGIPKPEASRSWEQFRLQAARRLVAANPTVTYTTAAPDILLAIPVLEVELNADGSIRRIDVLRYPRQAPDTTQIAIDALRRAAPFGDVSRLPKPWKFTETFLFDDERRFKPRTLD